ncbi:Eco57I restriction-modification methylase domain-containing protein [Sphingobacterium multivorum]|uniref:Eco57I restriction-modification methylase domain-containing protein n=1 Tax=Sphingobacterium multivorum TaxID=28454 RepID=UPI003DA5F5CC
MALEQIFDLLPSVYADELGLQYSSSVEKEHKKKLGQYFTPKEVAEYMASLYTPPENKTSIRILDPGCGLGILSCALCEHLSKSGHIHEIDLVVFETDLKLIDLAHKVFRYLQEWLEKKEIRFNYFLCANDFVLHNSSILKGEEHPLEVFDVAITNPPYFKVPKNDPLNRLTKSLLYGQQNIYSIFIFLIVKLLAQSGNLIFISPRSFTSGNYFRAFREFIFREIKFEKFHLFHSRKKVFSRDKVLQENLIAYCKKRQTALPGQMELDVNIDEVEISMSQGLEDILRTNSKTYQLTELVNLNSNQKIFHIPVSEQDEKAIAIFKNWTNSFSQSNIKISTGPVVSFRASEFLMSEKTADTVPLIWLNNISKMQMSWPLSESIKDDRPQFIVNDKKSVSLLVDNQNMVIIRRFSSKDDSSRLIAAPFFKCDFEYSQIGLENHVNYVYGEREQLSELCVWGISSLLNSTLFDVYFRTFNGNINVSATELRELPLPKMEIILKLGAAVKKVNDLTQDKLDSIVQRVFLN